MRTSGIQKIDSRKPMVSATRKDTLILYGTFLFFSALAVYCNYVFVYTTNDTINVSFREAALESYEWTLAGIESRPMQYRVMASYLIWVIESSTRMDPIVIDVMFKVLFLFLSVVPLHMISCRYLSPPGALAVVFLYLLEVVVGLTSGYSVYYTNDIILLACLHWCILLAVRRQYLLCVLCLVVATLAREVSVVILVYLGMRVFRGKMRFSWFIVSLLAFLIPLTYLRLMYPAPVQDWAWWDMIFVNVPGFNLIGSHFENVRHLDTVTVLRNNIKAFMLFNVLWILSIKNIWRYRDPFIVDIALTMLFYMGLVYAFGYIREPRLFLPCSVLILPTAMIELEKVANRIVSDVHTNH